MINYYKHHFVFILLILAHYISVIRWWSGIHPFVDMQRITTLLRLWE